MKKQLLLSILVLAAGDTFSQSTDHYRYVEAPELSAAIVTPQMVNHLQGPRRQKKPTWGLVETGNGDTTLMVGPIRKAPGADSLAKKNPGLSFYSIGDTIFPLPSKDYSMAFDGIMRTRKGKKIEALWLEFEPCPCGP